MQHYTDKVLYKTHQHILLLVLKVLRVGIPFAGIILIVWNFLYQWSTFSQGLIIVIWFFLIVLWQYFFWVKSYFIISNEKIIVKVRNGIFSKYHMSIQYKNIRDMAFSKNNIFHYIFWYGTFFARSSAGAIWDFEAKWIPNIEKVYKALNYLHTISDEDRKYISSMDEIISVDWDDVISLKEEEHIEEKKDEVNIEWEETLEEVIIKEKQVLLSIQGIKEVVLLNDEDRRYIFENEEDKNHWVYECLKKQILFVVIHDETFREPDEPIVLQAWEKVIFPDVDFHEIQRPNVSSSSPWLKVHEYLSHKFHKLDKLDATILIWFDI